MMLYGPELKTLNAGYQDQCLITKMRVLGQEKLQRGGGAPNAPPSLLRVKKFIKNNFEKIVLVNNNIFGLSNNFTKQRKLFKHAILK